MKIAGPMAAKYGKKHLNSTNLFCRNVRELTYGCEELSGIRDA